MNISGTSFAGIQNFERFIPAIKRTLSGESPMENGGPLTDDQIMLRLLNRELASQHSNQDVFASGQRAFGAVRDFRRANPQFSNMSAFASPDGSVTPVNSALEALELMNGHRRSQLGELLAGFNAQHGNGAGSENNGSGINITI